MQWDDRYTARQYVINLRHVNRIVDGRNLGKDSGISEWIRSLDEILILLSVITAQERTSLTWDYLVRRNSTPQAKRLNLLFQGLSSSWKLDDPRVACASSAVITSSPTISTKNFAFRYPLHHESTLNPLVNGISKIIDLL